MFLLFFFLHLTSDTYCINDAGKIRTFFSFNCHFQSQRNNETRMHFSRMRTARQCIERSACIGGGQWPSLPGGGGGGCLPPWPCDLSQDAFGVTPPSDLDRHACENITFARFATRAVVTKVALETRYTRVTPKRHTDYHHSRNCPVAMFSVRRVYI